MSMRGNISGTSPVPSSITNNYGLCCTKLLADDLLSDLKEAIERNWISVLLTNTQEIQLR